MPIKYDKLFTLLIENGYTSYKIRKENLIGQGTLTAIKNGTGGLDSKTISKFCKLFNCQPGDIMEYVDDDTNVFESIKQGLNEAIKYEQEDFSCVRTDTTKEVNLDSLTISDLYNLIIELRTEIEELRDRIVCAKNSYWKI